MRSRTLVSVVMPTYNHARYIRRAIESVLAQTHEHWELIVVDDQSTDNTAQVVAQFRDPRIHYALENHRGVERLAETMNVGANRASGELITMLGSDDRWPPHRLETQLPVFDDPNVVLCFGRQVLIDEHDNELGESPLPADVTEIINRPVGAVLRTLLVSSWIPQPTELIRLSALQRIGMYQQPSGLLGEDYPTHLALALQGEFRFIDDVLGYYRMHGSQMTRTHYSEMAATDVRYALEFFSKLSPEVQRLTGWTEASLRDHIALRVNNGHFTLGRRDLLAGNRRAASRRFLSALRDGDSTTRVKALVGLACCASGLDMERVVRAFGRPSLR